MFAGGVPVFVFVFAGLAVGLTRGDGVGVTGTVQSMMPLGCGMQFGSDINTLPPGTVTIPPPGPIGGPPGGGLLPFSHGFPASPGTAPPVGTIVLVFASYENSGGMLERFCSSTPVAGLIG